MSDHTILEEIRGALARRPVIDETFYHSEVVGDRVMIRGGADVDAWVTVTHGEVRIRCRDAPLGKSIFAVLRREVGWDMGMVVTVVDTIDGMRSYDVHPVLLRDAIVALDLSCFLVESFAEPETRIAQCRDRVTISCRGVPHACFEAHDGKVRAVSGPLAAYYTWWLATNYKGAPVVQFEDVVFERVFRVLVNTSIWQISRAGNAVTVQNIHGDDRAEIVLVAGQLYITGGVTALNVSSTLRYHRFDLVPMAPLLHRHESGVLSWSASDDADRDDAQE